MCSDAKNSRTHERSTARPSNWRENGVVPAPLSWTSCECSWPRFNRAAVAALAAVSAGERRAVAVAHVSSVAGGEPENHARKSRRGAVVGAKAERRRHLVRVEHERRIRRRYARPHAVKCAPTTSARPHRAPTSRSEMSSRGRLLSKPVGQSAIGRRIAALSVTRRAPRRPPEGARRRSPPRIRGSRGEWRPRRRGEECNARAVVISKT